MLGFHFGILCGWPSPAIFLLTSDKSPLPTGKITLDQATWVSSLKSGGMVICGLFVGSIARKFGRKRPLLLLSIPSIVSGH